MIVIDDELVLSLKITDCEVRGLTLQNVYTLWESHDDPEARDPRWNEWKNDTDDIQKMFRSSRVVLLCSSGDGVYGIYDALRERWTE